MYADKIKKSGWASKIKRRQQQQQWKVALIHK